MSTSYRRHLLDSGQCDTLAKSSTSTEGRLAQHALPSQSLLFLTHGGKAEWQGISMAGKAPIHPLRRGYSGTATPEVFAAVKRVISDWDGENWIAVRSCIQDYNPHLVSELDEWTMMDVRMHFAVAHRPMTIRLNGTLNTTSGTICPLEVGAIKVPVGEGGEKTSGGGREPKYSEEEIEKFSGWWGAFEKACKKAKVRATHEDFLEWGEDKVGADASFPTEIDEVLLLKRAIRYRKRKQTRRQK